MDKERRQNRAVGLFLLTTVVVLALLFFVVGNTQRLFARTYVLHTSFSDVSGLRVGAPVRLAGKDVGTVVVVRFSDSLDERRVLVELEVDRAYRQRIRRDSVAAITTQGLLGDKFVGLTVGSSGEPETQDGDTLASFEPLELQDALGSAKIGFDELGQAAVSIKELIRGPEGETTGKSLQDIIVSLRNIIQETEQGRGVLHDLIYDRTKSEHLGAILANLDESTAHVNDVLAEIKSGDGSAHKLVYESTLADTVASVERVANDLEALVNDVRNEEGLLHALIYDSEKAKLVANLEAASKDLKDMVNSVKEGEGTLGGLIADPTIYQDVKTLLGRAERNRILKAYVRKTLEENEKQAGLESGGGRVDE